jgi:predicted dehydrogenase
MRDVRGADVLRLGVLGAGNIADLNVAGYLDHPRCDVVAVCDVDAASAKAAAERWGVDRVYTEPEDLLGDEDVDAVEVLTPTHLHHEHVVAALQAGKHVSVQKPITNTVDQARHIAAVAEETGCTVRVSECFVHYPPLELAKALVADGAVGRPIGLRIRTVVGRTDSAFEKHLNPEGYGWRLDARSPGGHLFDDMVHKYAMASWLIDRRVTAVQAVVRRRDLFFEPCVALFEYDDPDVLGTMEVHYAKGMWLRSSYFGADELFEVQGEEGIVWVTRATGELLGQAPVVLYRGEPGRRRFTEFKDVDADWGAGFRRASAHFVDALLAGTEPAMTVAEAVGVLQLCFAVYQAGNTQARVDPRTIEGAVTPSGWAEW